MGIVLFAMVGAALKMGVAYWICFGFYCALRVLKGFIRITKS